MNDRHNYEKLFIRQLDKYREKKGVSQREMSLALGQTSGYISKITNPNNKQLPRMLNFFYICDYLNIHPKDFFDEEIEHPEMITNIVNQLYELDEKQLSYLLDLINDISKNK